MIKLYREFASPQADAIEAEFQDALLGYDTVTLTPQEAVEHFGRGHSLPILTNNAQIVSGAELPSFVNELRELMRSWLLRSGGTCYVDEDGNGC
jgi:hypothetical protein